MMQIKYLFALFAVLMLVVLGANEADADCLSGRYKGPCAVWDNETCRRVQGGGTLQWPLQPQSEVLVRRMLNP